ncbi:MAG: phage/plasmid primase, P4 family [Candidatus Helarchaeota archaeon]
MTDDSDFYTDVQLELFRSDAFGSLPSENFFDFISYTANILIKIFTTLQEIIENEAEFEQKQAIIIVKKHEDKFKLSQKLYKYNTRILVRKDSLIEDLKEICYNFDEANDFVYKFKDTYYINFHNTSIFCKIIKNKSRYILNFFKEDNLIHVMNLAENSIFNIIDESSKYYKKIHKIFEENSIDLTTINPSPQQIILDFLNTIQDDIFNEKNKKSHSEIADIIISKMPIYFYVAETKFFYVYNSPKGIYEIQDEENILKRIEYYDRELTKHDKSEILRHIKDRNMLNIYEFKDKVIKHKDYISFKNCVINFRTFEIKNHSPNYVIFTYIDLEFNIFKLFQTNLAKSKVNKFLKEITSRIDSNNNIVNNKVKYETLLEFIAYLFYPENEISQYLILYGSGANGKTTFVNLIIALIDKSNVADLSIKEIESAHFDLINLKNKLANIHDDMKLTELRDAGNLKRLVSGGWVESSVKYRVFRDAFYNRCKFLFTCNRLPFVSDFTDAFFRRIALIKFERQFFGQEANTRILDELTTEEELSNLLHLAITRLPKLLKNKKFSIYRSIEDTKHEYLYNSSTIYAFAYDNLQYNIASAIEGTALYDAYLIYCESNKLRATGRNKFYEIIQTIDFLKRIEKIRERNRVIFDKLAFKEDSDFANYNINTAEIEQLAENILEFIRENDETNIEAIILQFSSVDEDKIEDAVRFLKNNGRIYEETGGLLRVLE